MSEERKSREEKRRRDSRFTATEDATTHTVSIFDSWTPSGTDTSCSSTDNSSSAADCGGGF